MRNRSQLIISVLAAGFLTALQAEHVQPVFRVYEHGSDSIFVDVQTAVDPLKSTFERKIVKGRSPDRIDTVGTVEIVSFSEKR